MKYKTAFRLALRILGVLLFFQHLPGLVQVVGGLVANFLFDPFAGFGMPGVQIHDTYLLMFSPHFLSSLLGVLGGLYLFFGGV